MEIWTFQSGKRAFSPLSGSGQKETDIPFWGTLGNTIFFNLRERALKLDASCSVSIALMLARILRNGFYGEKAYLERVTPRLRIPLEAMYIRFRFAKLKLPGMPGVLSKEKRKKEEGRRKKEEGRRKKRRGRRGGSPGEKVHGKQRKE